MEILYADVYNNTVIPQIFPSSGPLNTSTEVTNSDVANIEVTYQEVLWLGIVKEKDLKLEKICTVFVIVAYTLVLIYGLIGNIVVILVISIKPHMKTVTNLFVLNLAVADMFVLIFCLPATLLANILKSWLLGSFMCSGVTYVQALSVIASAYSLVAISVDRFMFGRCKAICHNSMSTKGFSKAQAKKIILLIWIIALSLPMPSFFVFKLQELNGVMYCQEIWKQELVGLVHFLIANLFCCYILPFILITTACLIIWWKVSNRRMPQNEFCSYISSGSETVRNLHQKTKRGVGIMLIVVAFTFLFSWLPLYIIATFIELSSDFSDTERAILNVVVPMAQWLAYWNSCANPIIYAFYNSNFRKAAKSLIPSCFLKVLLLWCRR